MRTGMTQACTRMSAKAVSDWGGIPANSSQLNTCHSPSSHLLRGCCGGWSRSGGRKAPATPLGAIAALRNILLLGCYFTVTVTWQKQNIIMLHEKKNENKNTLVAANLQASASEMQQTSLIWVCLGDKAQDVLKSAPWTASLNSFAKPGEHQLLSLSKPEPSSFWNSSQCQAVTKRTLLLRSSPWAAARLHVESCGGGKRETRELPDWQAGFVVLFKMLNQSFTWRGGRRGWITVGRCLKEYSNTCISEAGRQRCLAGAVVSAAPKAVNVIVRQERAGSCWVARPTRESSFEQICSNLKG